MGCRMLFISNSYESVFSLDYWCTPEVTAMPPPIGIAIDQTRYQSLRGGTSTWLLHAVCRSDSA